MTAEYEKYLDDETAQFMENITFEQIVEALSMVKAGDERAYTVPKLLNGYRNAAFKSAIRSICYEYWRGCFDEKNNSDIRRENPFGEEYGPRT